MSLVVFIRDVARHLDTLQGLESTLVDSLFVGVGHRFDQADKLAGLGKPSETFKDVMHGGKVVKLIEVQLERVREPLASVMELWVSTGHIFKINQSSLSQVLNVSVGRRILIDQCCLVHVGRVHAQNWQFFNSCHFKTE